MSSTDVSGKPPSEEYALQTLSGSLSNSAGSPVHLKTANGDSNITVNKPPSKPKKSPLFPLTEGGSERFKLWQYLELSVLIVLIVVVWVLLFIPFIFYHIPSPGLEEEQQVYYTAIYITDFRMRIYFTAFVLSGKKTGYCSAVYIS